MATKDIYVWMLRLQHIVTVKAAPHKFSLFLLTWFIYNTMWILLQISLGLLSATNLWNWLKYIIKSVYFFI